MISRQTPFLRVPLLHQKQTFLPYPDTEIHLLLYSFGLHNQYPDSIRFCRLPIATIWAGAMMLDFLGNGDERFQQAHNGILAAIEEVIAHGPKTPDMKGNATTPQVADAICKIILR